MCGRARCSLAREDAAKKADVPEEAWKEIDKFEPRYNIQPGAHALAVVKDGEVKSSLISLHTTAHAKQNSVTCWRHDVIHMSQTASGMQGKRTIQAMTWGLVPSWTEESETKLDFFRSAALGGMQSFERQRHTKAQQVPCGRTGRGMMCPLTYPVHGMQDVQRQI